MYLFLHRILPAGIVQSFSKLGVSDIKILIVSQHFYPDSFRVNEIARELYKKGNDVTVLTSLPDYESGCVPKDCRGFKNRKIIYEGVKVVRSFSFSRRSGMIFRILNYLSFTISSTVKASFFKDKYDVVISYQTSPVLMANAARRVANKQKIPFLLYCLDLWPECIKAWGITEKNPLYKLMHSYSKSIYNRPDRVAVSSKPFKDYLVRVNGVSSEKIVYLPQHSDSFNLPDKQASDTVRFAFGGNIGSVQNIPIILKAVALIKDLEGFCFDLYGEGSELSNCKALAEELGITHKVAFHGRVSKEELLKAYKDIDAFILTLSGDSAIGLTVPAKLQEYMSCSRPVIAAIDGASAEIIADSGCGKCVSANDYRGLAATMEEFIKHPERFNDCGKKGKEYFDKYFTLDAFMDNLDNLIKVIQTI